MSHILLSSTSRSRGQTRLARGHGTLFLALCLTTLSWPTLAGAQSVPAVRLTEVVNGLTMPIGMAHAGDGSGRIFIVEQGGTVRIWDGTQLLAEPFLEIPVACCGERGLLGIAFHPNYATNGFFYAHYSNPAIPFDPLDDFQNGDFYGWRVGSDTTPFPPKLEPDAGPLGMGDDMLRLEADGGAGAGSRLVVFNESQWTGDFLVQGITEITMDLQNVGFNPLTIRIGMRGGGGNIVSTQAFELADNSGWVSVRFPIAVDEFVGLGADVAATLSSVTQLRILHNPLPEFIGEPIRGSLGIDNIASSGTVNGELGASVLSRFSVGSDPNVADPNSEVVLLTQEQPFGNHNGGQIGFGPDSYLYVALGDGGAGGDPLDHGQNPNTLLGSLLRLDVPADASDPNPRFTVPADNPFVGVAGFRDEIWAYGLRNPWRFSFDRGTGDLFIADVGQSAIEEVNHQLSSSPGGENYGWRRMEGSQCFNPASNCNDGTLVLPVMEYSHAQGCSITGGYRYRGGRYPSLDGVFFFGDFCTGTIWGGQEDTTGIWMHEQVLSSGLSISSFGEDENGEVYVLHYGGSMHRLDLVVAPTKITAPVAGTVLVAASTVNATGTGSNLAWTVTRQPGGGGVATGTGPTLSFVVPADSTALQSIVIELDGDGGTDTITYAIQPLPPLEARATAVPTTGAAPLNVQFTGAGVGGTGVYTFEWNFGDGSVLSIEQSPAHIYSAVGTFTAMLTVRDAVSGTATATVVITARPATGAGFQCDQIDAFWVASRRDYNCAVLSSGSRPYTDSDVVLSALPPELENTAWIQTASRDARRRRRWFMFFSVTAPVKVMVGFDAEATRLPSWLTRVWTDEGTTVTLDNGRVLNLYSREYEPGWVVILGANRAPGARWPRRVRPVNYVVGLVPGTP